MGRPRRIDGYAPIADYAAIGDGRTCALVAKDGAIDWLALPTMQSPAVFAAVLDADRGGSFRLEPAVDYRVERTYVPDTNVLATTFTTADGAVRVVDALNLHNWGLLAWTELARRVEGLSGTVPMRWTVRPAFRFGEEKAEIDVQSGVLLARGGGGVLAVQSFDAGEPSPGTDRIEGQFEISHGGRALVAVVFTDDEPVPVSRRDEIEHRLDATVAAWQRWTAGVEYDGDWPAAVRRSALALKLLIHSPTGAIAAAATTSLPERIGGDRNWDYRFCWLRDASFTIDSLIQLGLDEEAHASLSYVLDAVSRTQPRMQVFFGLDGTIPRNERELDLAGYRGSRPVRLGNGASGQIQLGTYGDVLECVWLYVRDGNLLDRRTAQALARTTDLVCEIWRHPDSGIWELRDQERHHTTSKIGCWVALDRALRLVERGDVPADNADRWRAERDAIRDYVETRCWSDRRGAYVMDADGDELDASTLLASRSDFADPTADRMQATVDVIRQELGRGPLLYRTSGLRNQEGAFLACSFWLVEALVGAGRMDEAASTMEQLLARANDVGLYAEQIDPDTGEFLGNFPQGLTHLSLVNAATLFSECRSG